MLSRTGRLAVLRGRNAELKDSTSRSQIEVGKEGLREDRHLKESWTKRNVVEEEKRKARGINNLDIRLQMGHTWLAKSFHSAKRQRVGWCSACC
jgi:hypothetical protein